MKLKELLEKWLEEKKKDRLKIRSYRRYEEVIALHIVPNIGDVQISELDRKKLKEFIEKERMYGNLKTGSKLSSSSINIILGILHGSYEYACDMGYAEKNPCRSIKREKESVKKTDAYTLDEQKCIERAVWHSRDRSLHGIILCLYTGMRIGELLALKWEDVDTQRGLISVNKTVYRAKDMEGIYRLHIATPKTAASERLIPLPKHISSMLERDRLDAVSEFVVESKKGESIPIRSYQQLFKRLAENSGVRCMNFHALRHTFATRAIERGIDVRTVADILGHKDVAMTLNRYAHCMIDHKLSIIQKLEAVT